MFALRNTKCRRGVSALFYRTYSVAIYTEHSYTAIINHWHPDSRVQSADAIGVRRAIPGRSKRRELKRLQTGRGLKLSGLAVSRKGGIIHTPIFTHLITCAESMNGKFIIREEQTCVFRSDWPCGSPNKDIRTFRSGYHFQQIFFSTTGGGGAIGNIKLNFPRNTNKRN